MMSLEHNISRWLNKPSPIWDPTISSLAIDSIVPPIDAKRYSIQQSLTGVYDDKQLLQLNNQQMFPLLELPSSLLSDFYDRHGLKPEQTENAAFKINRAFEEIQLVEAAYMDIMLLVKTIQIICSEQPVTDTSYSHPEIPFSIFISVCEDTSMISNLRVAESILHEAMHLKLSLVERIIPLVEFGSKTVYFSPWREEERPIRGVLHGLFVFRALFDFFKTIKRYKVSSKELDYLDNRLSQIKEEINSLVDFPNCNGLTRYGRELANSLSYSRL